MQLLAIESAAMTASAALLKDGRVAAEYTVDFKKTHSQTLLPMIDEIVSMTETDLKELDAIAVSEGPGSFTGLRIGSATAKGLALALGKPIIPVPTLAAMAWVCWGSAVPVCPMMDARRGQVFTGLYRFDGSGQMETVYDQRIVMLDEWLEELKKVGRPVLFLGDGAAVFEQEIRAALADCRMAPAHMSRQRAAAVGALGERLFSQGVCQTAAEHAPCYLRKSQAERERERTGVQQEQAQEPEAVIMEY